MQDSLKDKKITEEEYLELLPRIKQYVKKTNIADNKNKEQLLDSHENEPNYDLLCKKTTIETSVQEKIFHKLNEIELHLKALTDLVTENTIQNETNLYMLKKICKKLNIEVEEHLNIEVEEIVAFIEPKDVRLPVKTIEELSQVEFKCNTDKEYCKQLIKDLSTFDRKKNKIRCILRNLVKDEILLSYNWDGRHNKREMKTMTVFNKVLREACGDGFEEGIRNTICLAKNSTFHHKKKLKPKN